MACGVPLHAETQLALDRLAGQLEPLLGRRLARRELLEMLVDVFGDHPELLAFWRAASGE